MILIINVKIFGKPRAKAIPNYDLRLCRKDVIQNILITVSEHTTFIDRNLVTGV